jgi:hypothetical protein
MIPKRVRLQFHTLINAAEHHSLCVVETSNRKTGKPAWILCAQNDTNNYIPLAQLGPLHELHQPQHRNAKLI